MIQFKACKTGKWPLMFLFMVTVFLVNHADLRAQSIPTDDEELNLIILNADSLFWKGYNACNISIMANLIKDDVEFYHDKSGLTNTKKALMESLTSGLCANQNSRLRREAVEGSIKVYRMNKYGALISGEHKFYINEAGKAEYPDGVAKFTHLWQFENGVWKMSRILSYDHQPIAYENKNLAIAVPDKILDSYSGQYQAPQTGLVSMVKKDNGLEMTAGSMNLILQPKSNVLFFHEQSSLTFEFVKNADGEVIKLIVRENGQVVEEAKRIK